VTSTSRSSVDRPPSPIDRPPAADVRLDPPADRWPALARSAPCGEVLGRSLRDWRRLTRAELGLDTDRPLVGSGHQPVLWHPGLLAKAIAQAALAEAIGGGTFRLTVGHDELDPLAIDLPVRAADGGLGVRTVRLGAVHRDVVVDEQTPARPPDGWSLLRAAAADVLDPVRVALEDARQRLETAPGDRPRSLGEQVRLANARLVEPWVDLGPPAVERRAGDLLETTFARRLLEAMAEDPWACAEAYGAAVRAVPEAGIAPLHVRDDWVEVPLWRLRPDGSRMRAWDADVQRWLDDGPGDSVKAPALRPRALLLTALARLVAADVFVHGIGGGVYDRAMEGWIDRWLGVRPAPAVVATADLRLPLGMPAEPPPPEAIEAALHAARHARHDPWLATGDGPSERKSALLGALEAAPGGSIERRAAFVAMHAAIERARERDPVARDRVDRAEAERDRLLVRARSAPVAARRDWIVPLHEPAAIDAMARRIRAEFGR